MSKDPFDAALGKMTKRPITKSDVDKLNAAVKAGRPAKAKADPFDAALSKPAKKPAKPEDAPFDKALNKKPKKAKRAKKAKEKPAAQIGLHHTNVKHKVIFVVSSMTWLPSGFGTKRHVTSFTTSADAEKHAEKLRAGKLGGRHGGVAGHGNVSVKRVSLD